ncbi:MAG: hypothetical protein JOZ55_06205 [Alphaproteobacteria bacterium]|nr:hypothetical protein [Alphaproteobacteria bacterium]
MGAVQLGLLATAIAAAPALASDNADPAAAGASTSVVAPIHFDLKKPGPQAQGSLPTAATLDDLTYATQRQPATKPAAAPAHRAMAKAAPKAATKPPPKPASRPAAPMSAANSSKAPWMSEWRRAYIARHGHQPPVPARR